MGIWNDFRLRCSFIWLLNKSLVFVRLHHGLHVDPESMKYFSCAARNLCKNIFSQINGEEMFSFRQRKSIGNFAEIVLALDFLIKIMISDGSRRNEPKHFSSANLWCRTKKLFHFSLRIKCHEFYFHTFSWDQKLLFASIRGNKFQFITYKW